MYIQKLKNSILKSKSHFPMWTSHFGQTRMGDNTNLFTLSESVINVMKKPELVQKIITLKRKAIVDSDTSNLCNQILKLNDTISQSQLHSTNKKIIIDLTVVKNVNTKLEERIISLEKVKPSLSSTASIVILNYLVFQMIYQKIIWGKL